MRTEIDGLRAWRHDLAGCLHACAATLLRHEGVQPLHALGAGWTFYYPPGDCRPEEYYFPCRPGISLLTSIAPYYPVRSTWHQTDDPDRGWAEVRERVAGGTPVAVAVDNFHLPFRPAYQDVHANHLIIVSGFDDEAGTVRVLDAVPPLFDGDITLDRLVAARNSGNESNHDRDMFFADAPIRNRWLEVTVSPVRHPELDRAGVRRVVRRNLDGYGTPDDEDDYQGLSGLAHFLRDQETGLMRGRDIADELFVVAGAVLASTALHADWLSAAGRTLQLPVLLELGRSVDRIAHHWTAVRILAALSRKGEVSALRLRRRNDVLLGDLDLALARAASVLPEL